MYLDRARRKRPPGCVAPGEDPQQHLDVVPWSPASAVPALPQVQGCTFPLQDTNPFLLAGLRQEVGQTLLAALPSQPGVCNSPTQRGHWPLAQSRHLRCTVGFRGSFH